MAEIKSTVRINEHEVPALYKDLEDKPAQNRATRIRYLAALGVLVEQGRIPMILPGNVTPMEPSQVVPGLEGSAAAKKASDSQSLHDASQTLADGDLDQMLDFGENEPKETAQA